MELDDRIALFRDMMGCCHDLYLWIYDSAFHLISSNCPEQAAIQDLFAISYRGEEIGAQLREQDTPVIFSSEIGMMWIVAPLFQEEEMIRSYTIGPFFVDDTPQKGFTEYMDKRGISFQLRQDFLSFLCELPIISLNRVFEYAIMLYFCLTEQKISVSDLRYHRGSQHPFRDSEQRETMNVHGTYRGEQEMLKMVREGNLNYKSHMAKMSVTGHLGKLSNGDPLRQMKNAVLVCITLFSRAAIEGGLSPEVSYTLTDYYFQSVEACTSITDLGDISHTMQEDFIQRVHRCRIAQLSPAMRECLGYIETHLEENITLSTLAKQTGYSENYLTRKFKQEMGITPIVYIRNQRLEQAALLLRTTQDDVQTVSEKLGFCSQSYFAEHFRRRFGVTPTEYRQSPATVSSISSAQFISGRDA
ncbi:MAG: AraC family transcriptional regulator [bacterium]|nr:AraC family transcriptional regulator [bacterium]